tara:strand:- start:3463 stop:3624 length:162 start_codon:yes stop_codon:yes gene_type:complete
MNIGTKVKTAWGTGTITELKKVNGFGRTGLKLLRMVAVVTLDDGSQREVYVDN